MKKNKGPADNQTDKKMNENINEKVSENINDSSAENLKQHEQTAAENAEPAAGDSADYEEKKTEDNAPENVQEGVDELTPEESLARLAAAYAELEKTNRALTAEKQELSGQLARLQADFDNFRRRTRTEKEDWQRNNTAAFCSELLPIMDNFGRALQALKANEADAGHSAGVEMIARQLAELMAAKGVERIPAVGEAFDPNWHEAIGQVPVEDEEQAGKVVAEIQSGYRIGDKLLRASMVQVGCK